ncbi:MAG TPA: 8-oxo-dGTP diphosphatase [Candidatus Saccharimonadales bacterium]
MKQATLLFLFKDDQILLAMKKRGFGSGKWNGVGGKVEDGEAIIDATIRECQEEIEVNPKNIVEVAKLNFFFPSERSSNNQTVSVFTSKSWDGEPVETEEMAPKWFRVGEIPYDEMWSDDQFWLPKVIAGEFVNADFHFDDDDQLKKHSLESKPIII